jgi:hypothetical protein
MEKEHKPNRQTRRSMNSAKFIVSEGKVYKKTSKKSDYVEEIGDIKEWQTEDKMIEYAKQGRHLYYDEEISEDE